MNNYCNNPSKENLLSQIMSLNFAINDLTIYLDTHPNDTTALNLHNNYSEKLIYLTNQYQSLYGPLTINFTSDSWTWSDEPWPWERSNY